MVIGREIHLPYDEVLVVSDFKAIMGCIATFRPDVIMTRESFPTVLNLAAFEIRKRWIHVPLETPEQEVIHAIESCYAFNLWSKQPAAVHNPLVSVFTGTFNTGDFLRDTYQSLREQAWPNWEWVVVDDASSDGTWGQLLQIASEDSRVRPFKNALRCGKIGGVKDVATRLCRGEYLVELDHDDMLTDFALTEIVKAFQSEPEAGFVYSNCASFFEDGTPQRFEDDFWKDRYRWTEYRGKKYLECINPDMYDRFGPDFTQQFSYFLTVGPNHVRAFRAETFRDLGGYNHNLPVADDWDLYARFFLRSKCVHVDEMLYLYRYLDKGGNTTFLRNKSIQDHLELGRLNYWKEFKEFNDGRIINNSENPKEESRVYSAADISFVVPEGAKSELTVECLESIRKWAPGAEVILVSNGCESLPAAVALADKVVSLEMNLKFAAACNRGVFEASRDLVCILNNDAAFVDGTPDLLAGAVGKKGHIVAPYSNRAKPPQGDVSYPSPQQDLNTDMVVGVCMVMTTSLFRSLGGFDTRLYTYEDDDICYRAREIGKTCAVIGGTYVTHERHATFKARGEDVQEVMKENRAVFERKHPKIRVIAISKNEESCIKDFFLQFKQVTMDFCLLDTGSTDNTVALARSVGANVQAGIFENFAQARNEALTRFSGDADWIIMLDPDERLSQSALDHLKETLFRNRYDIFLAPLHAISPDGTSKVYVPKPFVFKNHPDIRWVFKVHEKLVGSGRQAIVVNCRIRHILKLHTVERRTASSLMYDALCQEEPYFMDAGYREEIRSKWPILDYDHQNDYRIDKIHLGPLVSVIVPTHRRTLLLEKALRSALAQDYTNLEILVVGDACPELDATIAYQGNSRIRFYNLPENHGSGGAVPRNYGIMLAAGNLIAYLDDDNTWSSNHISSLYAELRIQGAAFTFSSMKVRGTELLFEKPEPGSIDTSCVLHRKDLVHKYGWWKDRVEGGYSHDWEFFSRWIAGKEKWIATQKATLNYNIETCGQKEFLESRLAAIAGVQ